MKDTQTTLLKLYLQTYCHFSSVFSQVTWLSEKKVKKKTTLSIENIYANADHVECAFHNCSVPSDQSHDS